MCLSDEFFSKKNERINEWKCTGLSISEACSSLDYFDTTAYQVATEVADFIYENWTLRDIDKLPQATKDILFKILEPMKVKASCYLNFITSNKRLSRPFIFVEDISIIELLNKATSTGTDKEIYQKCLSILYLKKPSIFEREANEITHSSTDRVFLACSEEEILQGKSKPAEKASRDPLPLLVGRPRFVYAKLSNKDKLKNIERFFNKIFETDDIKFNDTDFSNHLAEKLQVMSPERAYELLKDLLW